MVKKGDAKKSSAKEPLKKESKSLQKKKKKIEDNSLKPSTKKTSTKANKSSFLKKPFFKNKKLKKTVFIVVGIVIISILLLQILSVKVKLLFETETHITLTPTIQHLIAAQKNPPVLTFTTSTTTLAVCDVMCSFTLQDTSTGKIVSEHTLIPPKVYSEDVMFPLPDYGAGQKVFHYVVECTVTERNLCPSKGKSYSKSSFITVEYGLRVDELAVEQELAALLENQTREIYELETQFVYAIEQNKALRQVSKASEFDTRSYARIASWLTQEQEVFKAWEIQHFALAKELALAQQELLVKLKEDLYKEIIVQKEETKQVQEAFAVANDVFKQREEFEQYASLLWLVDKVNLARLVSANNSYQAMFSDTTIFSPEELALSMKSITTSLQEVSRAYEQALRTQMNHSTTLKQAIHNASLLLNATLASNNCPEVQESLQLITSLENSTGLEANTLFASWYNQTYCSPTPSFSLFLFNPPSLIDSSEEQDVNYLQIPTPRAQCCLLEKCQPCGKTIHTPIILVHGHAFIKSASPELAFTRLGFLQDALAKQGFMHASTMNAQANIDSVPPGVWGDINAPLVVGITYYYLNYYELGQLSFVTRKTDRIENYAIRLKESIDIVREKTGSDQVILVAHSMGGLVSRSYLQMFGEEHVKTLIILGTPNHGIEGDIRRFCTVTGAKAECDDMYANGPFINRLQSFKPTTTKVYTITAVGCPTKGDEVTEDGDGVVLSRSVALSYAENFYVNGSCTDFLQKNLHMDFVNPLLYPETLTIVQNILQTQQE